MLKDFLGVPIQDGDQVLGIIFLANKACGPFTTDDQDVLTLFAAHAAIALTNARLYERGRELTVIEERQRMARELHDAVTQKLFSLRLTAQAASALLATDPEQGRAWSSTPSRGWPERPWPSSGRSSSSSGRPSSTATAWSRRCARTPASSTGSTPPRSPSRGRFEGELPAATEVAVLRVAQEAGHNALRHSGCSTLRIRLWRDRADLVLEVADDGCGFDGEPTLGLGLESMRDRAAGVGGRLEVISGPAPGRR